MSACASATPSTPRARCRSDSENGTPDSRRVAPLDRIHEIGGRLFDDAHGRSGKAETQAELNSRQHHREDDADEGDDEADPVVEEIAEGQHVSIPGPGNVMC